MACRRCCFNSRFAESTDSIGVALLLTLVGVLTVAAIAQAKGVNDKDDQWNAVMALPAETDIEVRSVSGDVIRARLQFASQVRLMVEEPSSASSSAHPH